jgi:hypothetical protein
MTVWRCPMQRRLLFLAFILFAATLLVPSSAPAQTKPTGKAAPAKTTAPAKTDDRHPDVVIRARRLRPNAGGEAEAGGGEKRRFEETPAG